MPSVTTKCVLAITMTFSGSILLAATKNQTNEVKKMNYEIKVETLTTQPAVVIKGKAKIEDVGNVIGKNLEKVAQYLKDQKSAPAGAPFTRTFSFENGVLEFESGFPAATKIAGKGEVIGTELPKGSTATTIHVGSQESSQNAYEAIQAWMAKNDKKEAGAPWEVYLTDPATTAPEKSKMQVYFPIR